MKKSLALLIAISAWFAVIVQYYLMYLNRTETALETTIRFFSFFTILTNTLVAVYFSKISTESLKSGLITGFSFRTLTAITMYILIVGLVYQTLLRHLWKPEGLQYVVDELLHSVNPVLVLIFWLMSKKNHRLEYRQLFPWLIFPLVYLLLVMVRGNFSGFYPYPFLDFNHLSFSQISINILGMTLFFILVSMVLIGISRWKKS